MLSRTAENLYWLARYVERAEYIARTIDATLRVTALPAAYVGKTNAWESALHTAGAGQGFTRPAARPMSRTSSRICRLRRPTPPRSGTA